MKTNFMNSKLVFAIAASGFLVACGEYSKEPVSDIEQLRENARTYHENGPEVPEVVYRDRERTVEVPVEVYVKAPSADEIVINAGKTVQNFVVGTSSKFTITVSSKRPGVVAELSADNRPDGSTLTKVKDGEYEFSWKPSSAAVPEGEVVQLYEVTFTPTVTKANSEDERKTLNGLINQTTTGLLVFLNPPKKSEASK